MQLSSSSPESKTYLQQANLPNPITTRMRRFSHISLLFRSRCGWVMLAWSAGGRNGLAAPPAAEALCPNWRPTSLGAKTPQVHTCSPRILPSSSSSHFIFSRLSGWTPPSFPFPPLLSSFLGRLPSRTSLPCFRPPCGLSCSSSWCVLPLLLLFFPPFPPFSLRCFRRFFVVLTMWFFCLRATFLPRVDLERPKNKILFWLLRGDDLIFISFIFLLVFMFFGFFDHL